MSGKLWSVIMGASLLGAATAASAEPFAKIGTVEGITEYRLSNGLQVLLFPDSSKPTVTVNLTVLVGSRHEGYGETGMAHLLEHMVFKGTAKHANIPKLLQERGARFNGTTWVDRTNYYETLPAEGDNLEFALKLEADRMMNSLIRAEDLFSEMTVVRNEFERGENSPSNLLQQRLMAVAFDWHNYGKSTIGNRSDIERVPVQNLRAFYQKYYQPDNAVLVVAGKFDEAAALKAIVETFGSIPKPTRELSRTYTDEPPQDGERSVTLRRVGEVGLAGVVYHTPAGSHPDSAALEVLATALDAAPSGRLYKALVETHQATSVSTFSFAWHDAGVFAADAEVRKEQPLDPVLKKLIETIESVGKEGLSDADVERAKLQILKRRELAEADTSRVAVQLSNWAAQGDWRLYFLHRDRVEKVTPVEVQQVAQKYLVRNNRTSGVFIPSESSGRITIPDRPDPTQLLAGYAGRESGALGEEFEPTPENIQARLQKVDVASELKVAILPKKTRGEIVELTVTLRYGNPEELQGFETAASFLPALMLRGTQSLTREQIQDELDRRRATLRASGSVGEASFSIQTKRSELVAVLGLLRRILREPSFPENEFQTLQRQRLASLEEQLNDPQSLALNYVRRTLSPYSPKDVRYSATFEEQITRTKAVTRDQIEQLYQKFLGARGEVAIVGDVDVEPTVDVLKQVFDGWNAKPGYQRISKKFFANIPGGMERINTPDKANASYMAGVAFPISDSHPDYPAILLGNFVLGGGSLSSRLGDRVRQQEGLSYGVGSLFGADPVDARASITLYAISNPQNVPQVVKAIREECERLIKDGMTEEELERAKNGFLRQMQIRRTSDRALTDTIAENLHAGRTFEYYAQLEKEVAELTSEQITKALQEHFDLNRLVIATAGDFSGAAAEK